MRVLARKSAIWLVFGGAVLVAAILVLRQSIPAEEPGTEEILAAYNEGAGYAGLKIRFPLDGTLFPPGIAPPVFRWEDGNSRSDRWLVDIKFEDGGHVSLVTREPRWSVDPNQWEVIKQRSLEREARLTVLGVSRRAPGKIISAGQISFKTSGDEVGAPLFYREVILPFIDAVKDPSRIRWRFGSISSAEPPPIVLENLPVCGNCHSFCRDGRTLAMDVDYANSKGSYVITPVAERMTLATSDIITWNDYRKEDKQQTFGLLSQISPDGRYVVSTVKDRSVFVPRPLLAFSQLFFPIKGILCTYDRQSGEFVSLPGADDPRYVQSNPSWSPDGRHIVFARSEAYELKGSRHADSVLLDPEECKEFLEEGKTFRFDLYRIAFNEGRGGQAEPLEGASNNGMSNFFARYSPDGKWIVFCKAKSFMLLQPDSELYIIPAEGGEARKLRCNTGRMNSWHSWSPNGRWLVFSSKAESDYTQLFLTHIDEQGRSSPAVLLSRLTAPDRAANIPEFVNARPSAIRNIREQFLDDYSFVRAGNEFFRAGDTDNAIEEYLKALELNPNNTEAHRRLGFLLYNAKGLAAEGMAHYNKAMEIDPNDPRTHHDIGMAFLHQRRLDRAVTHLSLALRGMPRGISQQYNAVDMHYNLGLALLLSGRLDEAEPHLNESIRLDPNKAEAHYQLAMALAEKRDIDGALKHYSRAVSLRPGIDVSAALHYLFSVNYAEGRDFEKAVASAEKALSLADEKKDKQLARTIKESLELYKRISNSL
ncbi:MAG: tetratricopeptide repeat protein [Phycisphaerales bacterium]|nr:MAG: tetratricopeptide repeat protein [Phycisphaerales bacterium]